jgi:hypothetical protein
MAVQPASTRSDLADQDPRAPVEVPARTNSCAGPVNNSTRGRRIITRDLGLCGPPSPIICRGITAHAGTRPIHFDSRLMGASSSRAPSVDSLQSCDRHKPMDLGQHRKSALHLDAFPGTCPPGHHCLSGPVGREGDTHIHDFYDPTNPPEGLGVLVQTCHQARCLRSS